MRAQKAEAAPGPLNLEAGGKGTRAGGSAGDRRPWVMPRPPPGAGLSILGMGETLRIPAAMHISLYRETVEYPQVRDPDGGAVVKCPLIK